MGENSDVRITWEDRQNEDYSSLHCDHALFSAGLFSGQTEKLTSEQKDFFDALRTIHGVTDISVYQYRINVTKGRVFAWDEIRPIVERLLGVWVRNQTESAAQERSGINPRREHDA